jgi:hypothetical protein
MAKFICYIDESGDEGIGTGGSDWFVLAGFVVDATDDLRIARLVNKIKKELKIPPKKVLHWRDLRHLEKKFVAEELSKEPSVISYVALYKDRLNRTPMLMTSQGLYFYSVRFLVERITWYVSNCQGRVDLIFSNRSSLDYDRLGRYVRYLQKEPSIQVRDVIDDISATAPGVKKNLQLADCACGALFNALEPDRLGSCEPSYLEKLKPRLYRYGGKVLGYGLKIFSYRPPDLQYYLGKYPWLRDL